MFDDSSFQTNDILHFQNNSTLTFKSGGFEEMGGEYKGDIIQINDE